MKKLVIQAVGLAAMSMIIVAQQPNYQAPIASNPVVEMKGKITKIQTAPGQGMPFLEMESDRGTTKVLLGSMRYLMQQNFNPKAGEEVVVKGYKTTDLVVATEVTLPGENKTLKLRDDKGRPVWMGGRRGRGGMRGCCGAGPGPRRP
jgi:hypothetical protein